MAGSGVDKQDYIINNTTSFSKSDGSSDDLSTWANNEISEAQSAYKYYQSVGDTEGMQAAHARAENARNQMGYYSSDDGSVLQKIDQAYVDAQVAKQQELWNQYNAAGNTKGMNEAHAAAERYRGLLGKAGGADGSQDLTSGHLQEWANQQITAAQQRWQEAYEKGDVDGMNKAHYDAEYARARLGYSGGADGSQHLDLYNGNNYQSDIYTPFVNNKSYNGKNYETPETNAAKNPNNGRAEVTLGGNKYWMDSAGMLYDSEGTLVGSGFNSATGQLTYTDENQATAAALKVLEDRYGVKGWDNILKRLGLSSIPQDLIQAAMSGTLSSYINNLETKGSNGSNNLDSNTLLSLLTTLIGNNGGMGNQYITPNRYNEAVYPVSNWADSTGTMASGYPSNTTPSSYGQFVGSLIGNPFGRR